MSTIISQVSKKKGEQPRRANDFLTAASAKGRHEALLDEFWQEGELAMMFGPPSSGKSLLALQLGDALARGGGVGVFRHPRGRRRVLYVDLRHTDEQFRMRCIGSAVHRFPQNLFRDRPPAGTDLCEWLRAYVAANGIQAVIIDDLSAVKNTHDGTRETLRLMRFLRQMRDEMHISILVIADSHGREGRLVSEADLGRSRVLCSVADSVFAVGRGLRRGGDHYLVQTRVRSRPIRWTPHNAMTAVVQRAPSGLLGLEFDDRFAAMDEKQRELIGRIAWMVEDCGKTFREIAILLNISKTWACTLYKRWPPTTSHDEFEPEPEPQAAVATAAAADLWEGEEEDEEDRWRYGFDADPVDLPPATPVYEHAAPPDPQLTAAAPQPGETSGWQRVNAMRSAAPAAWPRPGFDPRRQPFAAALRRPMIRDLERQLNGYGREIFVQERYYDGKPMIWYQQRPTGDYARHHRKGYGIQIQNLGPSGHIPLSRKHALRL